jgi:hypothetical protein
LWTVLILVARVAPGGLSPWQLCNAAWSIARHVDSFPPSPRRQLLHRLRPRREDTKDGGNLPTRGEERAIDDVNVRPPGGRHRDRGRRATEGADDADGNDKDIGEALSANIDAALDLIALRAA